MKKIMFDNHYGLEDAVLNGIKTMTRRLVATKGTHKLVEKMMNECDHDGVCNYLINRYSRFQLGDVVAIAQPYESLVKDVYHGQEENFANRIMEAHGKKKIAEVFGWTNKMYVRSDLMPHQIRITDIKIERLQNISDEDIMCEGIMEGEFMNTWDRFYYDEWGDVANHVTFKTRREAFASLIDKVSGKGTWESNLYVFVYTFELIK